MKDDWLSRCIYGAWFVSISSDSRKSHEHYIKTSRMRRTSSRRSIRLYSGRNGRCINVQKFQSQNGSDIWTRLPKHRWPKSWSSMEDPVVLLEHPLAGLLWEKQFEKILLKYSRETVPNWACFLVNREKGLFLSVYVDDLKLA